MFIIPARLEASLELAGRHGSAMSTPVKHPLTSQRPQHPQPPGPAANHNSGRAHLQDHPESGCVYKLASSSIQQDSTVPLNLVETTSPDLASPHSALQRSHRDSFSGLPPGQTKKKVHLTDPYREARIAGGPRPGPVQNHPRAALSDVHLELGAALPEAAATLAVLNDRQWYWTSQDQNVWSPLAVPEQPRRRGSRSPSRHRKWPRNRSSPSPYRPWKCPAQLRSLA